MQATSTHAISTRQPQPATTRPTRPETRAAGESAAKRTRLPDPAADGWARRAMHGNGFGDAGSW